MRARFEGLESYEFLGSKDFNVKTGEGSKG